MTNKEAIEKLREISNDYWDDDGYGGVTRSYVDGITAIDTAIEALKERKTGKWISDDPFHKKVTLENGQVSCSCHCSECGDWLTASDEYPCRGYYCPNCGAKMEVGDVRD